MTGDLDVFVRPTRDNAARLLDAVKAFGFPVEHLTPDDLGDPRPMLQMGVEPVQIRVMTAISGVTWDTAWQGHVVARRLTAFAKATSLARDAHQS